MDDQTPKPMNRKQRREAARRKVVPLTRKIPVSSIKMSPLRHPPNPEWLPYLQQIKTAFDGHYDRTLDEWMEGFQHDTNPEKEIAVWLLGAKGLTWAKARRDYSKAEQHDLFMMVMGLFANDNPTKILASVKAIPMAEADEILRAWGPTFGGVP